jgi:hypothetical protein
MTTKRFVTAALIIGAASMISVGLWARIDPAGFADWAGWPNHEHFLHDAGVFQIAIGLMLLVAVWWRDAVTVVLAGFVVTNALHAHNHYVDRADGGRPGDWQLLAVLAVLGAVALVVYLRPALRGRVR